MIPFGRFAFLFKIVVQSTVDDPVILAIRFFSPFIKLFLFQGAMFFLL